MSWVAHRVPVGIDAAGVYALNDWGGQQLIALAGAYGQDQTQYQTEADSYARIVSTTDPQNAASLIFTVTTKDGHTLVFSPMQATQMLTGLNAATPTSFTGAAWWGLTQDTDRAGNAVVYSYSAIHQNYGLLWGAEYAPMTQWLLTGPG